MEDKKDYFKKIGLMKALWLRTKSVNGGEILIVVLFSLLFYIFGLITADYKLYGENIGQFIKDYSTIIAMIGVIFTIVAVQQQTLELNKQSRHALRISLKNEYVAINIIEHAIQKNISIPVYKREFVKQHAPIELFTEYSCKFSNLKPSEKMRLEELISNARSRLSQYWS